MVCRIPTDAQTLREPAPLAGVAGIHHAASVARTADAQDNEVLAKIVAHNLCVLVQSFDELGIEARFGDEPERPNRQPSALTTGLSR